jgi:hypothetical protein
VPGTGSRAGWRLIQSKVTGRARAGRFKLRSKAAYCFVFSRLYRLPEI